MCLGGRVPNRCVRNGLAHFFETWNARQRSQKEQSRWSKRCVHSGLAHFRESWDTQGRLQKDQPRWPKRGVRNDLAHFLPQLGHTTNDPKGPVRIAETLCTQRF